jgi:thiamine kinase-like enzyme
MDTSLKSISLNRSSNGGGSCEKTVFAPIASSRASSSLPLTSSADVDLSGIILIDFEYAGYNYRGYDISNHFNEYAGFDFDIVGLFPKRNQRMDFYAYYIYSMISSITSLSGEERASSESKSKSKSMALNAAVERGLQPPVISTDPFTGDFTITYHPELTSSLPSSGDPLADFMQGFDEATISFSTLPNLYWGTWAIYKASNSAIDFDYIEYATKRFGGYFFIKKLQQEMGI